MSVSWVPLVLLFTFHSLMVSCVHIDGGCGPNSSVLENNIARDLYGIEVGHKRLMSEGEFGDEGMGLDQIPMILHRFLSSHYYEAERSLRSLIGRLSMCSETNLSGSIYIPEATIDFSKHVLIKAKQALSSLVQLIHCEEKITTIHREQDQQTDYQPPNSLATNSMNCFVDGTRCQFSPCALGNRLPLCAVGFAAGTTGGAGGPYYMVSRSDDDPNDPVPGTLRYAVDFAGRNNGGAWIIFKRSMMIKLMEKLWISSNTTIDGRGVNVTIVGKGLVLARVSNVILHNFEVVSTGQSDTVHVFDGSHHVWIDHLSSRDGNLGLVTVLQGSTDVTVSNCYLYNHNFNMLLGASDEDTMDHILRVTVYRNWFDSSNQRMPHCRWGYCHVVNNYYRDWKYYAIGGRVHAKVLSELNVFEPGRRLEVTPWFDRFTSDLTPTIVSSQDLMLKGATFHQFLKFDTVLNTPHSEFPSYILPVRPTGSLIGLVINCGGVMWGAKLNRCMATT